MHKSQSGYGGGTRCGRTGRTESVRTFFQFVALLDPPVIQQLPGVRGHGGKAKARTARLIDPGACTSVPEKWRSRGSLNTTVEALHRAAYRRAALAHVGHKSPSVCVLRQIRPKQASPRDDGNSAGAHESMMASNFLEILSGADPAADF